MGIYQNKSNKKWVVRIRKKNLNIDYYKSFTSKTLAKKDEQRVLAEIESGSFFKQNKNITFEDASKLYISNVVDIQCKDSSKQGYIGYLKNHIIPYFGEKLVHNITKLDCDNFIKYLKNKNKLKVERRVKAITISTSKTKLSNETIRHIHILCNAIFQYMVDSDILRKNPMSKVKKVPLERKEANFLNVEDCNKLLAIAEAKYPQYYLLLLVTIITGMRQGEALALTWDDIDFKNEIISVNKTYSKNKITTPKTKNSIRNIKIPKQLCLLLKKHYLSLKHKQLNLVFPNTKGNYINCRNLVNRFLKPCLAEANIKEIKWHELRHSCITALVENGVSIKYIQKQVGHSSENTTLRIYTHVTEEMEKRAVNVLSEAFTC